ncbi:unnamed protein product [Peronospora belbahrii]|uniref:Carbohydrate-binding protein n=1 Tax=Peronospora belbahrii TaxID=622444 RepID=A0ABN8D8R2_9STRA|nr:unnamed protein product [Peronospora belbahrii]
MQVSLWLFVIFVLLAGSETSNAISSVFAASSSECSSIDICYEGGAKSTPCTISNGNCPACVTFSDNGCYVLLNGVCPFGVDCTSMWNGMSSSTSSGSTTSSTKTNSETASESSTTTISTPSSPPSPTTETSVKPTSGESETVASPSSDTASSTSDSSGSTMKQSVSGGSDMSVVFAIIGAAIGVIAVAVIFLTLVRRSKAAHDEDDDDMTNTPPAFTKAPAVHASQSNASGAMYSSYNCSNRTTGMGSGNNAEIGLDASKGVSMNAVSYYNQQPPHNSAAPSPRVAGRAIPSQPVGMISNASMARPYGGSQNFGTSSAVNGFGATGYGQSGVGVNNQVPPTPVQHIPMGGVAPSPHVRRESYEF